MSSTMSIDETDGLSDFGMDSPRIGKESVKDIAKRIKETEFKVLCT